MPNSSITDIRPGNNISSGIAEIRTYLNYNEAWTIQVPFDNSPFHAQSKLPGFQKLQPSRKCDVDEVKRHLTRGKLTLNLIQYIDVRGNPDFAKASAMWLPVQAYYAVNGFGLAVLAARKGPDSLPTTHSAFLSEIASNYVQRLFPKPYSAMLKNGHRDFNHLAPEFINIADNRTPIGSGFNLNRADSTTRDAHITQCLDTTRKRLVDGKLKTERKRVKRPGKSRGVLKKPDQIKIARAFPPTTVLNYLYRSRIKSNYEDVTMYQESDNQALPVLGLVESTQMLATALCTLLLAILWRVIDKPTRNLLEKDCGLETLLQRI